MQTQGRRVQPTSVVPEPKEWNTVIWSLREGWAWGLKGHEHNALTHSLPEPGRDVWSRFSETSPGQVERAQHSGFSPPVCPNQLKSASRNGLFFKKNPSGEVGNLARKLGGEGLGGRGLSSKRTPMRTSKVGVIRLHHFYTDLFSLSSSPPS